MPRYVVLLRAVNLGAVNKVAMADLKKWLTAAGFEDVVTKGNSGNVVLTSSARASARVAGEVAKVLKARMKKDIGVVARSAAEMRKVVAAATFEGEPAKDERFLVTFLPKGEAYTVLRVGEAGPRDYGKVDGKQQDEGTTRSWKVVQDLAALAASGDGPL